MRERSDFSLCGGHTLAPEISEAMRKNSASSNSSSSDAASPQGLLPGGSGFFDDSPSSSTSSPPLSLVPIAVASLQPKTEPPPDFCEHWKALFPPGPKDQQPRNVCPSMCEICGDSATGYHYEVASCNGCKTFFRRAVLGQRKFACKKGGHCKNSMSKEVRVKCRACRFERCVESGMNPLAILSETNPEGNSVVREILSKRKMLPESAHSDQPSTSGEPSKLFIHPSVLECTMDRLIDELLHLELAHDKIRKSNYNPKPFDGLSVEECIKGHSKFGIDFGEAPPRVDNPHGRKFKFIPLEIRIRDRIPFGHGPNGKKECHNGKDKQSCWKEKPKMWPLVDLACAIEYIKTFDFFHMLDEQDKRILARNVALLTVYITNSFFSYEQKSDCTVHPDGLVPHFGQIPQWFACEEMRHDRETHYETVRRVKEMNMDRKEYVLLKALITCNPAIEDLSTRSREVMQQQRDRYAKSLMSYMMARRGLLEGPSAYAELMGHVGWLTGLAKRNKDLHLLICALGLRPPIFSPLMDEVFST